jgi:hypothetical protein
MSNRRPPPLSGDRNPDLGIWLVALLKNHPYFSIPSQAPTMYPHFECLSSPSLINRHHVPATTVPVQGRPNYRPTAPYARTIFKDFKWGRSNRPETLRISTPQSRPRQRPTPKIEHKLGRSGQRVRQRPISLELQIPSFSSFAPLTVRINPLPTLASHSGPWRLSHPG